MTFKVKGPKLYFNLTTIKIIETKIWYWDVHDSKSNKFQNIRMKIYFKFINVGK